MGRTFSMLPFNYLCLLMTIPLHAYNSRTRALHERK